jgi:hypothetical protein
MALLLASCATEPPAGPSEPLPEVSLGPVLDLLQIKTGFDKTFTIIDALGDVHVFIIAVDSKEVYHVVVTPDGTVQRERVESNTSPSSISAAFDSDGKLHLLLDDQHLVREGASWIVTSNTPWDDAGIKIHVPRLIQVDKGLVWTFQIDGKEIGARGRWELYGFGGYGAGIVFPWHVSSQKLVIVPETTVGEPVWYVLDPEDNLDTSNTMLAADSHGVLHIVYEACRIVIALSCAPRYAEFQLLPPGSGMKHGLPDTTAISKILYPVSGSQIPILGNERPNYFSRAAMAVDPETGTVLVARVNEQTSFVNTNGKWISLPGFPLSNYRATPAPAGGDAFHVMTTGKSDEVLYLRYRAGHWSGTVELGQGKGGYYGIASNGHNRAFVVWAKATEILGRWVVAIPEATNSIPAPPVDSGVDYPGEEKPIPKDLLDFANGKAELITGGWVTGYGAAITAGDAGHVTKYMHDSEQWDSLARQVLQTKYGDNLGWYYLGRAAEGMGLCDAAVLYYGISKERSEAWVTSCFRAGCFGIMLPDALEDRLLAVEAMRAAGKCSTPPGTSH